MTTMLQRGPSRLVTIFGAVLGLALLGAACDSEDGDDGGDDAAGTGDDGHGSHGDDGHGSHGDDGHGSHGDGDSGGAEATVEWVMMPGAMAATDTPIVGMFSIATDDEIHVTELRACMGHDVHDCGAAAEMDSFDENSAAMVSGDHYMGEITLAAGDWTIVGYAHIGPDPFITPHANVTVQ